MSHKGGYLKLNVFKNKNFIHIEVKDTGEGMDESIRNNIFDPFFTTKEPGKGTGLGLSVSQRIVQIFNGNISVESEPGKGTIFRIIFPGAKG